MTWLKRILITAVVLIGLSVLAIAVWPEGKYVPYQTTEADAVRLTKISVPPMAPDWTWRRFKTSDGVELRWGETGNAPTAKATFVYAPGYNGSLDAYGEQFNSLAARGWHVVGLDLRGQGESGGTRAAYPEKHVGKDLPLYSRDVREFLAAQDFARPIILAGSSFGGLITTQAVIEDPSLVDGYMPIVPAYRINIPNAGSARKLAAIATTLGAGEKFAPDQGPWQPWAPDLVPPAACPTDSPRIFYQDVIHTRNPDQRVSGVTYGLLDAWFKMGDVIVAGGHDHVGIPVTMIQATGDALVLNPPAAEVCAELPDCQLRVWDDTQHCTMLDRDEIIARTWDAADALLARVRNEEVRSP